MNVIFRRGAAAVMSSSPVLCPTATARHCCSTLEIQGSSLLGAGCSTGTEFAFPVKGTKYAASQGMKPRGRFYPQTRGHPYMLLFPFFLCLCRESPSILFSLKGIKREWSLARDCRSCGNCQLSTGPNVTGHRTS